MWGSKSLRTFHPRRRPGTRRGLAAGQSLRMQSVPLPFSQRSLETCMARPHHLQKRNHQKEAETRPDLPLSAAGWGGSVGPRAQALSQTAVTHPVWPPLEMPSSVVPTLAAGTGPPHGLCRQCDLGPGFGFGLRPLPATFTWTSCFISGLSFLITVMGIITVLTS